MIGMHPDAVALKTPAHRSQERLQLLPDPKVKQRAQPRLEYLPIPSGARRQAYRRFGSLPLIALQNGPHPRHDLINDGTGCEVEPDPDQPLALFIGYRGVAE